ncbi:hypothetical protein DRF65_23685 [Chryseobacterium pennae]|uniref:Uncharacterized protein n=1 Tax=Chryseobacterium pennae TaxID=2258962 RepID=A0A3D9C285_9FLAO|nr:MULTISPECIES: hypothetical protein [Chryseobacterium]MCS4301327.1 hypothetical protein [Chryseobacterium sp. BIGb0232]REC59914.1 hypothetical protein DRF65_23685 [Chryseobacterium pennae]ROS19813.1 hypothetical protein EDF65_0511 [Chryseobacterium nakagawai]
MKPLKVLSDLLPIPSYTVIILCFFFPFFLIKCGDTTLMSIKGTDLVTGVSQQAMNERMKENLKQNSPFGSAFGNDSSDKSSNTDSEYSPLNDSKDKKGKENIPPSPLIIIAFLAAIAGIVIHLIKSIKKKYIYHISISLVGLISLLAFYLTFQSKMEGLGNNQIGMGLGGEMTISYGFGTAFYICGALFLFLMLFFGVFSYYLKNDPKAIYDSSNQRSDS